MKDVLSAVTTVKDVVNQTVTMSSCYPWHPVPSKSSLSPFSRPDPIHLKSDSKSSGLFFALDGRGPNKG